MKKSKSAPANALVWLIALGVALYGIITEIRLRNLEAETDLVYDAQQCATIGDDRAKVDACFASRGYHVQPLGGDQIEQHLRAEVALKGVLPRSYVVWLMFGSDGKLRSCSLGSPVGVL